jgi:hypothetical protein
MLEGFPFHGECVAVKPEDVMWINGPDLKLDAVVECGETVV